MRKDLRKKFKKYLESKSALCYRLTFNQAHTKLIAESGLKLVALGQSRTTGEVLLMINNQRGITYNILSNKR